jgi:hypothetical protein
MAWVPQCGTLVHMFVAPFDEHAGDNSSGMCAGRPAVSYGNREFKAEDHREVI